MRERNRLVSNSSSSSFIFAYKKGVDIQRMLDILGVRAESPLSDMAESVIWQLFKAPKYRNQEEFAKDYDWEGDKDLLRAWERGWTVHAGYASDEDWSNYGAIILCNLSLNIETDDVILKKESGY